MKYQLGRSVVETNHIQHALEQSNRVILTFVSGDTLEVYCDIEDENLGNFDAATQLTPVELNRTILKPGTQQKLNRKIPFSHQDTWWRVYSEWFREQNEWRCEKCGLSLNEDRIYLDTHHIRGIQHNDPNDLKALCIGCHAEEETPMDHSFMKTDERYRAFVNKYKPSLAGSRDTNIAKEFAKAYWDQFKSYVEEKGNQLQLFPEPKLHSIYGIQIDSDTLNNRDIFNNDAIWLIAYRNETELQANLCLRSPIHYSHLKNVKGNLEAVLGELRWDDNKRWIGFFDNTVGHVREADTDQEFSWLHDKLVSLHTVFQPYVLELSVDSNL